MWSWYPLRGLMAAIGLVLAASGSCAAAEARYRLNGGEALDTVTGLTWARCSVGQHWRSGTGCVGTVQKLTFAEAQIQANLHWRLPTAEELQTLRTPTGHAHANGAVHYVDEAVFPPAAEESSYWSSSGVTPIDGMAVTFFDEVPAFVTHRLELYAVRLVRRPDPQIGSSMDRARGVKVTGPVSVIRQQSSSRMPKAPGM